MSEPYIICIEGNIGSGKSTLLNKLKDFDFITIKEPVNEIWQKYLPIFYKNKSRWGFCFQLEVLNWYKKLNKLYIDKIKNNKNKNKIIICIERSPITCMKIFTTDLLECKFITDWEYSLLERYYLDINWKPDCVFYLKCNPDKALNRIKIRNRNGENNINYDFLKKLHCKHEQMYNEKNNKYLNHKTIIIDANKEMENVFNIVLKKLNNIKLNLN